MEILSNNFDKIHWPYLSGNPNAITILKKEMAKGDGNSIDIHGLVDNPNANAMQILDEMIQLGNLEEDVNWGALCKNPGAISIIKKYPNNIRWDYLCLNPSKEVISMLDEKINEKKNPYPLSYTKVNWGWICRHPHAMPIIEKYFIKIDWKELSKNPSAISMLEKNLDRVDWINLSGNPMAIHILEKNLTKVDWTNLSGNPMAIHILEKNLNKVNWNTLSLNRKALHILKLEDNIININWRNLSENPDIFVPIYDYSKIKKNMDITRDALTEEIYKPERYLRNLDSHEYDISTDEKVKDDDWRLRKNRR
jgi:hypothetical protein